MAASWRATPAGRRRGRRRARPGRGSAARRARSRASRSPVGVRPPARRRSSRSRPAASEHPQRGVGRPADGGRSPVVDMIEVRVRTRSGGLSATSLGDHAAHRRADQMDASEAERVEQAGSVGGQVGEARTARRLWSPPERRHDIGRAGVVAGAWTARRRGCRSGRRRARGRRAGGRSRPASRSSASPRPMTSSTGGSSAPPKVSYASSNVAHLGPLDVTGRHGRDGNRPAAVIHLRRTRTPSVRPATIT